MTEKWFRRLLKLFPRDFRDKHGRPMEQVFREQLREADTREARASVWVTTIQDAVRTAPREHLRILLHDTKLALRGMRGSLGVSLAAILTLALGIGANATMFSVVNTILLRPLPFRDGDQLVRVFATRDGGRPYLSPTNPILYEAVEEQGTFFEGIVAQRYTNITVETQDGPERIAGMAVTAGWLDVLGIEPYLGRGFSEDEEELGLSADVVLVSHGFWSRRLAADPGAVGRHTLRFDQRSLTVIGVLPPGFQYPYENELWVPMNLTRDRDGFWGFNIQARLKKTTTLQRARAELAVLADRIDERDPDLLRGLNLTVIPTREILLGDDSGFVLFLLAAVGFVLLLVCVNLGNLLLARAIARQPEMALRTALGASRLRQIRQVLTESLTLAFIGGAGGLALAFWMTGFTKALIPGRMTNLLDGVTIDFNVLLFTLCVTVLTGLLFGSAPAVRATGHRLSDVLKQSKALGSRHRLSAALVVGEIALALMILAGAGALMTHYGQLYDADLGYDGSRIVLASVPLEDGVYAEDGARRAQFLEDAIERLEALPDVSGAGAAALFPSIRGNQMVEAAVEGRPIDLETPIALNHRLVTPGFFEALGMTLRQGRGFTEDDGPEAPPVAVISERAASRYFSGTDPIGQRIRNLRDPDESNWVTVIGVVSDVREFYHVHETWYVPYAQHAEGRAAGQAIFTVNARTTPDAIYRPVRAALQEVDSTLPVFDIESIQDLYWESLGEQRLGALLGGLFAGFGLIMAALGIAGVMAHSVGRRVHELGLRIALGAAPRNILLSIFAQGARWTALGIAIGTAGSLLLTRLLAGLVPEIDGFDGLTVAGVSLLLFLVALAACYFPARRAVRIDPLAALRAD